MGFVAVPTIALAMLLADKQDASAQMQDLSAGAWMLEEVVQVRDGNRFVRDKFKPPVIYKFYKRGPVKIFGENTATKGTVKIDVEASPGKIELEFEPDILGRVFEYHGVYEIKGDTLRICLIDSTLKLPDNFNPTDRAKLSVFKRIESPD